MFSKPDLVFLFLQFFHQAVFGRPTFRFPSGVHVKTIRQSLSSLFLSICPVHFCLLVFASIFFNLAVFKISLFDIACGHQSFRILLRHLSWNVSNLSGCRFRSASRSHIERCGCAELKANSVGGLSGCFI